jgi:hypothetical protein
MLTMNLRTRILMSRSSGVRKESRPRTSCAASGNLAMVVHCGKFGSWPSCGAGAYVF